MPMQAAANKLSVRVVALTFSTLKLITTMIVVKTDSKATIKMQPTLDSKILFVQELKQILAKLPIDMPKRKVTSLMNMLVQSVDLI